MHTTLRVVTPPVQEPVSLVDAKKHLRVYHDYEDDLIAGLITAARVQVENYLSRAIAPQTLLWTVNMSDTPPALSLIPMPLMVLPIFLSTPLLMNKLFELPRAPVTSVVSVTQTAIDGMQTTLTPDEYLLDLALEPARLRLNWTTTPAMTENMQIEFVAGYDGTTNVVPMPILHAVKLWVSFLYEHRGDVSEAAGRPPQAIEWLLAPHRIYTFGG